MFRPAAVVRSFQTLGILLPPLAALAPKAVVPLLCLIAIPALVSAWRHGWRPRPDAALAVILGLWALWALIACLWSFDPWDSLVMWLRDGSLIALGLLLWDIAGRLDRDSRQRVARTLPLGVVGGVLAIAFALISDHALKRLFDGIPEGPLPTGDSRLNRGATTMTMLLAPGLLVLVQEERPWLAVSAGLAALAAIAATPSDTALVACLGAVIAAGLAYPGSQLARWAFALGAATFVFAMPLTARALAAIPRELLGWLPGTGLHRLHIWDFTAARIAERPWSGWGFNSAEDMPNFGVTPFNPDWSRVIPLHPHNGALQIWLDLGLPGILVAMALLALLLRRASTGPAAARTARLACLAAMLVVALLGYGFWQEDWLATLVILGVLVPMAAPEPPQTAGRP